MQTTMKISVVLSLLVPNVLGQTEQYRLWGAEDVQDALQRWQSEYPNLVKVETAQSAFGLSRAGKAGDCAFESDVKGCSNSFFTIQDFILHPEGSESSNALPEVFWNGAMHGTDRLGPTVVMETASLLLESATCEAKPGIGSTDVQEALDCRSELLSKGIDNQRRLWLARLVSTRRIVIIPAANSLGFSRNETLEESYDPDKDFPYDPDADNATCMTSIAARTVNELFRNHLFQMALSFKSGPDMIGFSWESKYWGQYWFSPDLKAQKGVAGAREASLFSGYKMEIGQINKLTGGQRFGTAEDWAYAASWDTKRLTFCSPTSYGGYPEDKTSYHNSTNRALSLIVSTEQNQHGFDRKLGNSLHLFQYQHQASIVPENMRIALSSLDLVQPYVSIVNVDKVLLSDDIVPMIQPGARRCDKQNAVMVPSETNQVTIEWTAGGALHFSGVELWYANWRDIEDGELDCLTQPNFDIRKDFRFKKGFLVKALDMEMGTGSGMYAPSGSHPLPENSSTGAGKRLGPIFRGRVPLDDYTIGDKLVVIARLIADSDWAVASEQYAFGPHMDPQTHLINARTNLDWNHENNGKVIQGRLDWFSAPVTIVLANYDSSLGAMLLHDRLRDDGSSHGSTSSGQDMPGTGPRIHSASPTNNGVHFGTLIAVLVGVSITVLFVHIAYREHNARKWKGRGDDQSNRSISMAHKANAFSDDPFGVETIDFGDSHFGVETLEFEEMQFEDLQAPVPRLSRGLDPPLALDYGGDDDSIIVFSHLHESEEEIKDAPAALGYGGDDDSIIVFSHFHDCEEEIIFDTTGFMI